VTLPDTPESAVEWIRQTVPREHWPELIAALREPAYPTDPEITAWELEACAAIADALEKFAATNPP